MKKTFLFIILIAGVICTSCRNGDFEFPDYDYSAVYFAYQSPVRTITLGNDYVNDNSLDNEHKCQIMATVGGFREIKNDIEIGFRVDNSLCDALSNVKPMPSNYYSLSDNKMVIAKGKQPFIGGVVVQLTDAFFADPLSISTNYVIPLMITDVKNADRILTGTALSTASNPNRYISEDWEVAPKDYILYAVKFINNWDAVYLRRGKDIVTKDGVTSTATRRENHVEDDELVKLNTVSLSEIEFPTSYTNVDGVNLNMKIKMTFNSNQECVLSPFVTEYSVNNNVRVFDIAVRGQGNYVKDGEKKSWGNTDRDVLYLSYEVDYKVETNLSGTVEIQTMKYSTMDTLVIRDRAVKPEYFTPVLK